MAMSSVYRGDYCPGGKCDNAGALQKVSLVPRLVVPSFQEDGFHCSVQKLCRRWDYLPLVRGWTQDGLRYLLFWAESLDVKYGSLSVALGNS